MAAADRSDRYRERMIAQGMVKVTVWVPVGSEPKVREWAARERNCFAAVAAARSRPATLSHDADVLRALTVAAQLQSDLPEATIKSSARVILAGKKGTDLYKV